MAIVRWGDSMHPPYHWPRISPRVNPCTSTHVLSKGAKVRTQVSGGDATGPRAPERAGPPPSSRSAAAW